MFICKINEYIQLCPTRTFADYTLQRSLTIFATLFLCKYSVLFNRQITQVIIAVHLIFKTNNIFVQSDFSFSSFLHELPARILLNCTHLRLGKGKSGLRKIEFAGGTLKAAANIQTFIICYKGEFNCFIKTIYT